ncbi:hypothetical protein, variant [Aphanomyces invadans]|uniref:Uncharacterized protein n=1 Tax=Aphanomyces invadans TaxID=157072 RepID=A0A024TF36_9STRA|nr:hypothetical protein, variant [Aphanomyces invadans]ETV91922.1 hypothetical protein, variant [Aphanomyces invadans]|eukprot:XP_008879559.1 hypothetical protein, variant [Aphanomyces invadans]
MDEHTQLPWKVAFRVQFNTDKYGIKFYPSPLPDTGNGVYTIQVLDVPRAQDPTTWGPAQLYNESLKPEQAHLAVRAGLYLTHINDTNLVNQTCEQVIRQLTSVPRPVKLRFVDVEAGVVTLKELKDGRYTRTSLTKAHIDGLLDESPDSTSILPASPTATRSPPVESRDVTVLSPPQPVTPAPEAPSIASPLATVLPLPTPTPAPAAPAPVAPVVPTPVEQAAPPPRSQPTYTAEHVYKLILLGTTGVGKSSILSVGVGGASAFSDRPAATLDAEFGTLYVPDPDLTSVKMLKAYVWDTAGQERYRAMTRSHYRRADGALLVYDVAEPESFQKLAGWLADLRDVAGDSIKSILVVENMIDKLPESVVTGAEPRPSSFVNEADVAAFCNSNGLLFAKTSAKMNSTAFRWAGKPVDEVMGQLLLNVHASHLARGIKQQQEQLAKQLAQPSPTHAVALSPPAAPIVLDPASTSANARIKAGDCACGGT